MRFRVLAFVSIIIAGIIWWFTRPFYTSMAPKSSSTQETTQLSQSTPKMTKVPPPQVNFKKNLGEYDTKHAVFLPPPILDGPAGNDAAPMDRYRGLKMGDPVSVNGRQQLVLGARGVPTPKYNSSFGPILFEKYGYAIVALNTSADPAWTELIMHESDRPLIVNPSNGRLGIVTGTLMIKFSDIHQADKLAGRENLQLMSVDESIDVGYFKAPENYRLLSASDRLRQDPGILRVELEVVESFKGAW
ncbi:MAG: hypothetical protein ACXVA9_03780 [Bdellovibrionales bacterium]